MNMRFSSEEKKELLKAWAGISLAFAIVMAGFSLSSRFFIALMISAITVGAGFFFHELSHKYVAQRYGCYAEFRAYDNMLLLAIAMSFFGFLFAAPGGVFIQGYVGIVRHGKIAAAGIAANIAAALGFLAMSLIPGTIIQMIASYGVMINAWLALFNLIPLGNFDGVKVLRWDKKAYIGLILAAGFLMVFQSVI